MRLIVAVVVLVVAARDAAAYPQFQLAKGSEKCGDCHLSPAGGGLLNDFGRDEAGSTISRGGDGRFLHGLWTPPDGLAIGGDIRFATGVRDTADVTTTHFFPMQNDLNLRYMRGAFAVAATFGLRGAAREPEPTYTERLASREHYVSYAGDELHARVGRFYPVFGLRLPDHTAYVRRHLGHYLHEEPYGVELAHYGDETEVHVTAFVPQPSPYLGLANQYGATAHIERRVTDSAIVGAHLRGAFDDIAGSYTTGAIAKWWLPSPGLLLLAELDLQSQVFHRASAEGSRGQLAAYLGASHYPTQGLVVTGAVQLWDPDLFLADTTRAAADVHAQFFFRAHWELHLLARLTAVGDSLALLQVHYYL